MGELGNGEGWLETDLLSKMTNFILTMTGCSAGKGSVGRNVAAVKKGVQKCAEMVKLSVKPIKELCSDLPAFQMSENSLSGSCLLSSDTERAGE